jgi:YD repeat-containing protein
MRAIAKYLGVLLIGVLATAVLSAQSGPVNYVYDELGRLVAVIDGTVRGLSTFMTLSET